MDGVTYQQWLMLIKISLLEDKNEMMIVELKEKIKRLTKERSEEKSLKKREQIQAYIEYLQNKITKELK